MRFDRIVWSALLLGSVFAWTSTGYAVECHVDTTRERRVTFKSDAPIEDFEGVTDRIDGYVIWSHEELQTGDDYGDSELYFEVDLSALDTGIGLRNRHMRENYLETDKYPYASYSGKLDRVSVNDDGAFLVQSSGKLSIHGVEQAHSIVCRVTREGSTYRIQCEFAVQLPDFSIDVPSFMFLKISETIELALDFHVTIVQPEN
jgi:polyisoprenoid-binding protein YceI